MSDPTSAKGPLLLCFGLVLAGVVVAAIGGLTAGSILGGVIAATGAIPAAIAAWKGMQQETQGSLATGLAGVFVALGVGGLLVLLRLFDWVR
jgi:hypothetical protein